MRTEVLIVGAGPTGLVLALVLTRLGVSVRIVDEREGPGETSRAFAVQARTMELYSQLGLEETVLRRGRRLSALSVHDRRKLIAHIPFGDFGRGLSPFPFILILLQDVHEKLLLSRLAEAGVQVERCAELIVFEEDGDRIRARLRKQNRGEESCEVEYLCGCDGVHSAIRSLVQATYEGGTYSGEFYVADVDASGAMVDSEVHYALAGPELCRVFPLIGEQRVRLIGRVPEIANSSGPPVTFEDVAFEVSEATGLKVHVVEWFSTYRVHHRVATHFRRGRVFLLGDACHAHSPALSQGLNTGVGDAVNLGWKLGAVLQGTASPALLDTYEQERRSVARTVVATTDLAFGLQVNPARTMQAFRLRVARLMPVLMGFRVVRELFFFMVSQLLLHYRRSPLSAGKAGRIAGGDRLPWIRLGDNVDNFGPLRALCWQVHVYGQASERMQQFCTRHRMPLHEFPWARSMQQTGVARNAVYLIRPDGYVAYASSDQDPQGMERLLSKFGISPAPEANYQHRRKSETA